MELLTFLLISAIALIARTQLADEDEATILQLQDFTNKRTCVGNIKYLLSNYIPANFDTYVNTSAVNEADCAKMCFEKLDFCFAARFDRSIKRCFYSYKGQTCNEDRKKLDHLSEVPSNAQHVYIYCVDCDADIVKEKQKPNIKDFDSRLTHKSASLLKNAHKHLPSAQSKNSKKGHSNGINQRKNQNGKAKTGHRNSSKAPSNRALLPSLPKFTTESPRSDSVARTTVNNFDLPGGSSMIGENGTALLNFSSTDLEDGVQPKLVLPFGVPVLVDNQTLLHFPEERALENVILPPFLKKNEFNKQYFARKENVSRKESNGGGNDLPNLLPFLINPPVFNNFFAEPLQTPAFFNRKRVGVIQPKSECPEVPLMPCSFGIGRNCSIISQPDGCELCACPYKSPARGCLGPPFLDHQQRHDLLDRRIRCGPGSSRRFAQSVFRFYRKLDASGDECVDMKMPYCGFAVDVNLHRMPRTKAECYFYCYSDDELRSKNISFEL